MLTSKQRAYLRALAGSENAIMQVGKGGISDNLIQTTKDALEARELIKMSVLETSASPVREIAETLAAAAGAEVVTVIGRKFVLYRRREKNPGIVLP